MQIQTTHLPTEAITTWIDSARPGVCRIAKATQAVRSYGVGCRLKGSPRSLLWINYRRESSSPALMRKVVIQRSSATGSRYSVKIIETQYVASPSEDRTTLTLNPNKIQSNATSNQTGAPLFESKFPLPSYMFPCHGTVHLCETYPRKISFSRHFPRYVGVIMQRKHMPLSIPEPALSTSLEQEPR